MWETSKGLRITVPPGCRTATVLLPFETSIPTAVSYTHLDVYKRQLRYPAADLDETIYRPERQLDTQRIERLSTCHWIEEGKNLIVTGASASGKTYLINAFCVTAMKQSKSVKYRCV